MSSKSVLKEVSQILENGKEWQTQLQEICELLKNAFTHYDWVGFYFANHKNKTLHLGPYAGNHTDHNIIPFGKGICGQVAESNETFLVEDVSAQDNYIACSIDVKSEIVVPLFVKGKNIGQIDIDSNTPNAFSKQDEDFLKAINEKLADEIFSKNTMDILKEVF